jgi:hypothetical protein
MKEIIKKRYPDDSLLPKLEHSKQEHIQSEGQTSFNATQLFGGDSANSSIKKTIQFNTTNLI